MNSDKNNRENDWSATAIAASSQIRAICAEEGNQDMEKFLRETEERLRMGLFRLVVMGEIKKGKSSFINALLGVPEAVPTGSDVATSTVFKIIYGPERRYKVFFKPDVDSGARVSPQEIPGDQIPEFGTESGNPDNRKNVEFIGVELPSPMLKSGLVMIDTPGVGGLFRKHRDITWQYAPRADAVCFVLDSVSAVISQQEIEFLTDLTSNITKRIFFVQTKTDTVDEQQWKSWSDRNRGILIDKLGIPSDKIRYFCVSSQLKQEADENNDGFDLNESGFLPVLDFLHNGLIAVKERELAKDLAEVTENVAIQLVGAISERKRIFTAESQEQLEEIRTDLTNSREKFTTWRNSTLQGELKTFSERMTDLRRNGERRIQEEIDPQGVYVEETIDSLRASEAKASEFNEAAGLILQECVGHLTKTVMDVQGEFNHQFEILLHETLSSLAKGFEVHLEGTGDQRQARELEILVDPAKSLNLELSGTFGKLQRSAMGGSVGSALAYTGIGLVSLVFPPAVAAAPIAAILGGIVGGWSLGVEGEKKERALVLDRMRGELSRTVTQVQRKALMQFRENSDKLERSSRDKIDDLAADINEQLENRMKELMEAQKLNSEESAKRVKEAEVKLKQIEIQKNRLQPIRTS